MPKKASDTRIESPRMAGQRRQFLTYMDPEVIKDIKRAALDRDTSASDLVEQAVKEWLKKQKR